MSVIYVSISGFPGYRVGNDGSVWSEKHGRGRWKKLKGLCDKDGYFMAILYRDGKGHTKKVHRLVLENFVGMCPEGMECLHLDDYKSNNMLENLKWGTREENLFHRRAAGTHYQGENHYASKIKLADISKIMEMRKSGISQEKVSQVFGVSRITISNIETSKTWKHVPRPRKESYEEAR